MLWKPNPSTANHSKTLSKIYLLLFSSGFLLLKWKRNSCCTSLRNKKNQLAASQKELWSNQWIHITLHIFIDYCMMVYFSVIPWSDTPTLGEVDTMQQKLMSSIQIILLLPLTAMGLTGKYKTSWNSCFS